MFIESKATADISQKRSPRSKGTRAGFKFNVSSQKLGFFKWRTSKPCRRSANYVLREKRYSRDSDTAIDNDESRRNSLGNEQEEASIITSIPKTASFLSLSSVDPFMIFPGEEDQSLVHEVFYHARNQFWPHLSPVRRPKEDLSDTSHGFYVQMWDNKMFCWMYL